MFSLLQKLILIAISTQFTFCSPQDDIVDKKKQKIDANNLKIQKLQDEIDKNDNRIDELKKQKLPINVKQDESINIINEEIKRFVLGATDDESLLNAVLNCLSKNGLDKNSLYLPLDPNIVENTQDSFNAEFASKMKPYLQGSRSYFHCVILKDKKMFSNYLSGGVEEMYRYYKKADPLLSTNHEILSKANDKYIYIVDDGDITDVKNEMKDYKETFLKKLAEESIKKIESKKPNLKNSFLENQNKIKILNQFGKFPPSFFNFTIAIVNEILQAPKCIIVTAKNESDVKQAIPYTAFKAAGSQYSAYLDDYAGKEGFNSNSRITLSTHTDFYDRIAEVGNKLEKGSFILFNTSNGSESQTKAPSTRLYKVDEVIDIDSLKNVTSSGNSKECEIQLYSEGGTKKVQILIEHAK